MQRTHPYTKHTHTHTREHTAQHDSRAKHTNKTTQACRPRIKRHAEHMQLHQFHDCFHRQQMQKQAGNMFIVSLCIKYKYNQWIINHTRRGWHQFLKQMCILKYLFDNQFLKILFLTCLWPVVSLWKTLRSQKQKTKLLCAVPLRPPRPWQETGHCLFIRLASMLFSWHQAQPPWENCRKRVRERAVEWLSDGFRSRFLCRGRQSSPCHRDTTHFCWVYEKAPSD